MTISWNKKVLVGIFTLITGLLLISLNLVDAALGLAIVNAGSIITIASYAASRRKEAVAHDERTRALGAKAASYSWMITFVLIAILVWLFQYNVITLSVNALLGLILAEMSVTMLLSKWWLGKKEF